MSFKAGITFLLIFFYSNLVRAQSYKADTVYENHAGGITVMTNDPANKYLIAGDDKGYLYFHDFKTGAFLKRIKTHDAPVSQLRFNSNGKLLISATEDGEIKIYDFEKEKIVQSIYSSDY